MSSGSVAPSEAQPSNDIQQPAYNAPNDTTLKLHLSHRCENERELRHALWHALTGENGDLDRLTRKTRAYFTYYEDIVSRIGARCSIKTHAELIDVVHQLRNPTTVCEEIVQRLTRAAQDAVTRSLAAPEGDGSGSSETDDSEPDLEQKARYTVWLAARILTMHEIGTLSQSVQPWTVSWERGSLTNKLKETHPPCQNNSMNDIMLNFDAFKLETIAGLKIKFVDNLAQHLDVNRFDKELVLSIFPHIRYLRAMQHGVNNDLFPPDLLLETLRTLYLLFPVTNNRKVLEHFNDRINDDPAVDSLLLDRRPDEEAMHLHITLSQYSYWRDRLRALNHYMNTTESESMWQVIWDLRHPEARLAIMLALGALILTAIFGLVQSVEGGVQAYKAYFPGTSS